MNEEEEAGSNGDGSVKKLKPPVLQVCNRGLVRLHPFTEKWVGPRET